MVEKSNITDTIKELMEINKIPKINLKDIKLKRRLEREDKLKSIEELIKMKRLLLKFLKRWIGNV